VSGGYSPHVTNLSTTSFPHVPFIYTVWFTRPAAMMSNDD
jgi:hypothetical protein